MSDTRARDDSPLHYSIAPDSDWVTTVRQALPRARLVLGNLRPTWTFPDLASVDAAFLQRAGVRALIWDVDGTLTYCHGDAPAAEARDAFEGLLRTDGLSHLILSNCNEIRFAHLAGLFPTLPVLKGYRSASGPVFRSRHLGHESWSGRAKGLLRPIRKPDASLVAYALHVLGGMEPASVALVGDQYLTDVATANLAGIRSIKLPTIGRSSFPRSVRLLQQVDEWLYRLTV